MLIRSTDPIAYKIKAVYVDDVKQENILALNPHEGWVEIHDFVTQRRLGVDDVPYMLRYTAEGKPITKRVTGKIRIEWHGA